MYEEFYGLGEKPFSIQPDPAFLYWGRGHRLAYAMLEYGVLNHAGISVITGDVGCGKTTLIHRLLDQLSDTHTVALLSNIQAGRGDLLSWVLMGYGQPFSEKSHVEMFAQLQSFFISEYANGRRVVLIIDEAQNLSSDQLEEIRMLSNINAGKDQLLQLILVGQPQLKKILNHPDMLQLAQRVGSDFHLTPLSKDEVHAYIDTRLTIAGGQRRIFTERAVDRIAEKSRGVPRIINVICDTALVYGFSTSSSVIDHDTIENVIRDKIDYGVFGFAEPEIEKNAAREAREADEADSNPALRDVSAPPRSWKSAGKPPRKTRSAANKSAAPKRSANDSVAARSAQSASRGKQAGLAIKEKPQVDLMPQIRSVPPPPPNVAAAKVDLAPPQRVAAAPETKPSPRAVRQLRTDPAAIGVVVLSSPDRANPEAAVRSAAAVGAVVFVARGSIPEAVAAARSAGAQIVQLPEVSLRTIGRARNAGYRALKKILPELQYVQFLHAGQAIDPDWFDTARRFMDKRPEVAAIEGPNVEGASNADARRSGGVIQAGIDGEIQTVDGGLLLRADRFESVGGFRGDLAENDGADLCLRIRRGGAHIWRIAQPMTISRPIKKSLNGWWADAVRTGYQYAHGSALHGGPPERFRLMETARAVFWGGLYPFFVVAIAAAGGLGAYFFAPAADPLLIFLGVFGLGILAYFFKFLIYVFANGAMRPTVWRSAVASTFAHFGEFGGILKFWLSGRNIAAPAAKTK